MFAYSVTILADPCDYKRWHKKNCYIRKFLGKDSRLQCKQILLVCVIMSVDAQEKSFLAIFFEK